MIIIFILSLLLCILICCITAIIHIYTTQCRNLKDVQHHMSNIINKITISYFNYQEPVFITKRVTEMEFGALMFIKDEYLPGRNF
jgi:hypothetical protein